MTVEILNADCLDAMQFCIEDNSVDAIVTDPPYGLSFMGKRWDYDVPSAELWREALRVLKPGGHLLAFAGTRTQHRMACAIEDAGFEIRDMLAWVYGSGFPKSLDVSKAIDKAAGADRLVLSRRSAAVGFDTEKQGGGGWAAGEILETAPATESAKRWQGWGTALKPALEPITLARKPLVGTVAENVLGFGVGALNVDGCRVGDEVLPAMVAGQAKIGTFERGVMVTPERVGRWPANLIHDGSDEVLAAFPQAPGQQGDLTGQSKGRKSKGIFGDMPPAREALKRNDAGSAARFFYCAKASKSDRGEGNTHPTVKPLALMRYLCRLVTPPGGLILDPFAGSGSTGVAAVREGFRFLGVEQDPGYVEIARARLAREIEQMLKGVA